MNKFYIVFCLISALFFTAVTMPAFAWEQGSGGFGGSGAGGSWGNSDGFGGNNGSSGASAGGSCKANFMGTSYSSPSAAGTAACSYFGRGGLIGWAKSGSNTATEPTPSKNGTHYPVCAKGGAFGAVNLTDCDAPIPDCPVGEHWDGSRCVKSLKCPAGYEKQGDKCVWQCPEGFKKVGGSCVPDNQPEDCDPSLQECDEDGKPKCNICEKLTNLTNNQQTIINNDNRVISLTETLVSNQNITNNNLNTVNNNLNTINNNMSTINNNIQNIDNSVQELITTINEKNPTIDTTALENKIDEVINAINNNTGGGDGGDVPPDLQPVIDKMNDLNQSIIDNKYDDIALQTKVDELINKDLDLSSITDRQDEQTSILDDIKKLLMIQKDADGNPDLDMPEVEQEELDLWGAISGFDIHKNIINASSQCPADKEFTVNLGFKSATFAIPMSNICTYLSYLAPVFLMLAYFSGAMIILRAGD